MLHLLLCFSETRSVIQPYLEIPSSALRFMNDSIALSRNNVIWETALLCFSVTLYERRTNYVVFQLK